MIGTVWQLNSRRIGESRKMMTAVVGDGTGEIQMNWFNPYVERQLHIGHALTSSAARSTVIAADCRSAIPYLSRSTACRLTQGGWCPSTP